MSGKIDIATNVTPDILERAVLDLDAGFRMLSSVTPSVDQARDLDTDQLTAIGNAETRRRTGAGYALSSLVGLTKAIHRSEPLGCEQQPAAANTNPRVMGRRAIDQVLLSSTGYVLGLSEHYTHDCGPVDIDSNPDFEVLAEAAFVLHGGAVSESPKKLVVASNMPVFEDDPNKPWFTC